MSSDVPDLFKQLLFIIVLIVILIFVAYIDYHGYHVFSHANHNYHDHAKPVVTANKATDIIYIVGLSIQVAMVGLRLGLVQEL